MILWNEEPNGHVDTNQKPNFRKVRWYIYAETSSGLLKNSSDFSLVSVIYPRSLFVFPALTATIYIFGAGGSEHKSEEYLNLTLLSNASWPTFITMYPASVEP